MARGGLVDQGVTWRYLESRHPRLTSMYRDSGVNLEADFSGVVNAAVLVERSLGSFSSGETVHYNNLMFAEIQ